MAKRKHVSTKEVKDYIITHKKPKLTTNQQRVLNKDKARIQKQNSFKKVTAAERKEKNENKKRKQIATSCMTPAQRWYNRNKAKKIKQQWRAKMTQNAKSAQNEIDKKRKQQCRAKMTQSAKSAQNEIDKRRKQQSRAKMSHDEKSVQRKIYHKKQMCQKSHITSIKPTATHFNEDKMPVHTLGLMNATCSACNAWMFDKEKHNKFDKYSLCCNYGKVRIPHIKQPPLELQNLFTEPDTQAKEFRKNIRQYNSSLALASVGIDLGNTFKFDNRGPWAYKISGQLYHSLGNLLPNDNSSPKFSQIYVYDTDHELENRSKIFQDINKKTLETLQTIMHNENPYVHEYVQAADVIKENPTESIKLVLKASGTPDPRRFNLPRGSDIAIIIPDENTSSEISYRDVVLYKSAKDHPNKQSLVKIHELHPMYDPTAYPLLFIYGDKGYDYEAFKKSTENKVTQRQFYRYRFMEKKNDFNALHYAGRLFQQYMCDMWCKTEKEQLDLLRRMQPKLRSDVYQGITDAVSTQNYEQLGTKVILPSQHIGSPRQLHQHYLDAMALVRSEGKPQLFTTFTCYAKWPEITNHLQPDQNATDRADIMSRVFNMKSKEFINDLTKLDYFGKVKAYCWTLEEQKRSLKHIHMLVTLDKHVTPEWIDTVTWAFIPDKNKMPKLYDVVINLMLHGPCGVFNPNSPCMVDGKCRANFPKDFRQYTTMSEDGFAQYARPDDGIFVEKNGFRYDNRWVVPYNPVFALKYNAHINFEICASVKNVKYIYKYIHKGADMASVGAQNLDKNDEIKKYVTSRWITASTASWNMFEFKTHDRYPPVERLAIHEENMQKITFRAGHEKEALSKNHDTTLTAWMKCNRDDPSARSIKYPDFPRSFRWDKSKKKWFRRKNKTLSVGRVYSTSPAQGERHYLRMLLYHRAGATCWTDLKTVNGVVLNTFKQTCHALGILQDDKEHELCLEESAAKDMPAQLRSLFSVILVYCDPADPLNLWTKFKDSMCDDIAHKIRQNDANIPPMQIENEALKLIEKELESMDKSLSDFQGMPIPNKEMTISLEHQVIQDEQYDQNAQHAQFAKLSAQLNMQQSDILNTVLHTVFAENSAKRLYVINSPGGYGKTFLFTAILSAVRSKGKIALAVAPTGLAAENLEGGRTCHSRFKIPIPTLEDSVCEIPSQSSLAKLLRMTELIVWDEIFASHKHLLQCVDRSMQDLRKSQLPFGGCTVLFGGDSMQTLPVVKYGNEAQIISSSVQKSDLWSNVIELHLITNMRVNSQEKDFCKYLLQVGKGQHEICDKERPHLMKIPQEYRAPDLDSLINSVFPHLESGYRDKYFLANRTILTPLNATVDSINSMCVEIFPGKVHTYLSADTLHSDSSNLDIPVEYLNTITPSGFPPHELHLKPNTVVMLLRNLRHGKTRSLRNGTRLLIKQLGKHMIECETVTGTSKGLTIFLPRIPIHLRNSTELPFNMTRLQFPIRPCFAMTINKSQGQSMEAIGVFLPQPVFSHGQLYVALSRVKTHKSLFICLGEDSDSQKGFTHNIVCQSILS